MREFGVSQGTFYLYFQTKDDVIAALADDRSQGDAMVGAIAGAEADPVVGLATLFDLHGQTLGDPQRADERRVAIQGWPRRCATRPSASGSSPTRRGSRRKSRGSSSAASRPDDSGRTPSRMGSPAR